MLKLYLDYAKLSLLAPKEAARALMALAPAREQLWMILAVVVTVSVLLTSLVNWIVPPSPGQASMIPFANAPVLSALIFWGLMVVMVFCTHYIGQAFGGQGRFEHALMTVIWVQGLMIALQLLQIALLLVVPPLAMLVGMVGLLIFMWVYVNFVAFIHGFENLFMVLVGIVLSLFGVLFGLSLMAALLAALLGVELPNAQPL